MWKPWNTKRSKNKHIQIQSVSFICHCFLPEATWKVNTCLYISLPNSKFSTKNEKWQNTEGNQLRTHTALSNNTPALLIERRNFVVYFESLWSSKSGKVNVKCHGFQSKWDLLNELLEEPTVIPLNEYVVLYSHYHLFPVGKTTLTFCCCCYSNHGHFFMM